MREKEEGVEGESGACARRGRPPLASPPLAPSAGSVCLDVINQTWSPMFGARERRGGRSREESRRLAARPTAPRPHHPPLSFPDLINVFEVFLPQLLLYPNAADPLNGEAAALLTREPAAYAAKVRDYVRRYANPEDVVARRGAGVNAGAGGSGGRGGEGGEGGDDDGSGFLSSSDEDEPAAGAMDA